MLQHWKAMSQVDELIMIIPVVLNLKGNLEMNLSARLGTAANVGELDKPVVRRKLILGNLSLLQVQATVVSFVAAVVAFTLGRVMPPQPTGPPGSPVNETNIEDAFVPRGFLAARTFLEARKPIPITHNVGPGGLNECVKCYPSN
jgi:solute carrier family 41